MTKRFHLGDILSITDGKLISPSGMDGIYSILGYMTDNPGITTIELPAAARVCKPALCEQHPHLSSIRVPSVEELASKGLAREDTYSMWLAEAVERYGALHDVTPLENPALDLTPELERLAGTHVPVGRKLARTHMREAGLR